MKIKMKLLYSVKLQVFFVKLVNSKLFLSKALGPADQAI